MVNGVNVFLDACQYLHLVDQADSEVFLTLGALCGKTLRAHSFGFLWVVGQHIEQFVEPGNVAVLHRFGFAHEEIVDPV